MILQKVSQQMLEPLLKIFHFSSVVDNINLPATNFNSDLSKINAWTKQWKMIFNSHPNKQAQEVIFSRKLKKT